MNFPDSQAFLEHCHVPLERIRFAPHATRSTVETINEGALFCMAFWSGASIRSFSRLTEALARPGFEHLELVVADVDGSPEIRKLPEFHGMIEGYGEVAWIRSGEIVRISWNESEHVMNAEALLATRRSDRPSATVSDVERHLAAQLRTFLQNHPVGSNLRPVADLRDMLESLERFVVEMLAEVHDEWQDESLDGILPSFVTKSCAAGAELFGVCYLITDQAHVPIHVRLQAAPDADEIRWCECWLGETSETGMIRDKGDPKELQKRLRSPDELSWHYAVTFGEPTA